MANKKTKTYEEKYNDIPKTTLERASSLFSKSNLRDSDIEKLKQRIQDIKNIEYDEISLVFYMLPKATPRPRLSRFTNTFYVKGAMDNSNLFKEFVESSPELNFKIGTPCEFYCKTFFPIPSNFNKIETILAELGLIKNISKPDWDNLGKTYSDMIQKHLLLDDSLIYHGSVIKSYSIKPRIEVRVRFMKDHDSSYNENKVKNWLSSK